MSKNKLSVSGLDLSTINIPPHRPRITKVDNISRYMTVIYKFIFSQLWLKDSIP